MPLALYTLNISSVAFATCSSLHKIHFFFTSQCLSSLNQHLPSGHVICDMCTKYMHICICEFLEI